MRFWLNLAGYQLVWLAAVMWAAAGRPWLAVAVALVFALLQWLASAQRHSDLRLVAAALLLGVVLDGALAAAGILHYASATPALLAPLWILAIWVAFAMTLNHSLGFLRGRSWLAALLGAVGGPLAYLGAADGFGALAWVAPRPQALVVLAIGWAIAMATLAVLVQRWRNIDRGVGEATA